MKYCVIACLILLTACAPARKAIVKQNYPKPFEFELIDTVAGSKNEIYVKAHEWISKTFGSAKAVIDMQDKEAGKLIGKAVMPVNGEITYAMGRIPYVSNVNYIISIDVKDNKYRCVISNFNHTSDPVHVGNNNNYTPSSYGDLSKDVVYYTSLNNGKKVEDKNYYDTKNQVMKGCLDILDDLMD